MWDYKEFLRKAGRTHATMLALMDEFPEFKFCQSQAVTYKEIKENLEKVVDTDIISLEEVVLSL